MPQRPQVFPPRTSGNSPLCPTGHWHFGVAALLPLKFFILITLSRASGTTDHVRSLDDYLLLLLLMSLLQYLRDTIQTLLWAMFTLIVQEMKEVVSKYMNLHIFLLFMLNKKTYLPEDILNLRKIIYNLVILLVREFDGWHNNHYLHKVFNHYEEVRIMDRCASYKH